MILRGDSPVPNVSTQQPTSGTLKGISAVHETALLSIPRGPRGLPGEPGAPGATGATGPQGPQGPAGSQRPKVYHVDDYGADPTGATESNQALIDAYEAMGSEPGVVEFGVGTYLLHVGLNEDAGRLLREGQGVLGQGSALTKIDYRGPGALFELRNTTFGSTGNTPSAGVHKLTILGWSSGENNSYGIRYGDIWRMRISDVEISGFNRPGCIGLWGDNQTNWSERAHIECTVNQCTECFVFESNTGSPASGSFDYSQYWLSFVIQPDQHGFVLRSGASGSKASMNGASITLTGNCQLAPVGGSNSGVMFRVGKDDADAANFSGELQIGVETSGLAGGVAHYDFMQGSGPDYLISSRVTASGSINLIPFSGSNFQAGNANPSTFAFGGMLKGSPALGSTGNVRSFQSLQMVSQPRGGLYLDYTNAVQTIYVTRATGGTFTLTFNGQTTSALPYNASPAQVQTALRALSTVGAGVDVFQGQARYIDSTMVDERAYLVVFVGPLAATDVPMITATSSLTGSSPEATVVLKSPGSPHKTYVFGIEGGSIFTVEPPPGTYRARVDMGGLTALPGPPYLGGDSQFGVNVVDIWIKQPDMGGPAIFEGPFFAPRFDAGSSYEFKWMDGQDPIMSLVPGAIDIIRLTSYNFTKWVGQHLTRLTTTNVPPPASSTSPGVKGQISFDANYQYTCIADNTWKRSPLSTW